MTINQKPVGIAFSDPNITDLNVNGVAVTSTAAELNILDGVTATAAELNTLADEVASMTTAATPAAGTCGVQFVFKNAAGNAIGTQRVLQMFISDTNGVLAAAATGVAALTNGKVAELVTGQIAFVETTAAGLLGVTLTNGAGNYYLSFVLPNGKVITSTVLTVN